jgi:hypothetical protein
MANDVKLTQEQYLLAEVVMKVAAIERLLIKVGIITANDLSDEMKKVSEEVISFIDKKTAESQKEDKDSN